MTKNNYNPYNIMNCIKFNLLKIALLAYVFIVFSGICYGQFEFKGTIVNALTKIPISEASILDYKNNIIYNTDENGVFQVRTVDSFLEATILAMSYVEQNIVIPAYQQTNVVVELKEESFAIDEVVITKSKVRYRNKNNPAVDLIRSVVAHKSNNDIRDYNSYQIDAYDKIVLSTVNAQKHLKNNPLIKNLDYFIDNIDSTTYNGFRLMPVYMQERLYHQNYYQPSNDFKQVIYGIKQTKYNERFINNDNILESMDMLFQEFDIYNNNLKIFTNSFVSPIADFAPNFYKYFIVDTQLNNKNERIIELYYSPRSKSDLLLKGNLWINIDQDFGVTEVTMDVDKDVNINWVSFFKIRLSYDRLNDGKYLLKQRKLLSQLKAFELGNGVFAEWTTHYKTLLVAPAFKTSDYTGDKTVILSDAQDKSVDWNSERPVQLVDAQNQLYENVEKLNKHRFFNTVLHTVNIFTSGFEDFGAFEVGDVTSFITYNFVEGLRLKLGGRTTVKLSEKGFFEGYAAYGFRDKSWKYNASLSWALNNKSIYSYPMHYIRLKMRHDMMIPGQDESYIKDETILLSIKRGINDKYLLVNELGAEYVTEFANHMSFRGKISKMTYYPKGNLYFESLNANNEVYPLESLNNTVVGIQWRWAPNEQFFQRKHHRSSIQNRYPIITLGADFGLKDVLNGDYSYQHFRAQVTKRFYLSFLGLADVDLDAGYLNGQVPFPLLFIAQANQSYGYQLSSYNLMNFLEFVSDRYVGLKIDYHMYGFLFNKVPLFKKLRFREVGSLKLLYGGLRADNYAQKGNELFSFPRSKDGVPLTYTLSDKPYIEAGFGVENILNCIRIDVIKRLSYLDHPNVNDWGVRFRINLDF